MYSVNWIAFSEDVTFMLHKFPPIGSTTPGEREEATAMTLTAQERVDE